MDPEGARLRKMPSASYDMFAKIALNALVSDVQIQEHPSIAVQI
jgi:hypothetical protein